MSKSQLEKAGLTKNEALVYNTLLKHGELIVSRLSRFTGLTREYIYVIAKELKLKELIEEIPNRKILTFKILPPINLKNYIKKKKNTIEEEEAIIESILPELTNHFNLANNFKAEISSFKGEEGIKHIMDGVFYGDNIPREILIIETPNNKSMISYLNNHSKKMSRAGINVKIVCPNLIKLPEKIDGEKIKREVRYIDNQFFNFPSEISIGKNKVFFTSYNNPKIVIAVRNKNIHDTFYNLFQFLWNIAKK